MLKHKIVFSGLAAMTATLLSVDFSPTPAPRPGPGNVVSSIKSFLAAADAGDREALARHVADRGPGQLYGFDQAGGSIRQLEGSGATFYDVSASGTLLEAANREEIVAAILRDVTGGGEVKTQLNSIRAECASGPCSFAILEFDRVYTEGERKRVVPMRATALVAYVGGDAPAFRLFHWHASRVQPSER